MGTSVICDRSNLMSDERTAGDDFSRVCSVIEMRPNSRQPNDSLPRSQVHPELHAGINVKKG